MLLGCVRRMEFCESCERSLCSSCVKFNTCGGCGQQLCSDCAPQWANCNSAFCGFVVVKCHVPTVRLCVLCGSTERCENCDQWKCIACQPSCGLYLRLACFTCPRSERPTVSAPLPPSSHILNAKSKPCPLLREIKTTHQSMVENRAARVIQRAACDWLWKPVQRDGNQCINVRLAFLELQEHLIA